MYGVTECCVFVQDTSYKTACRLCCLCALIDVSPGTTVIGKLVDGALYRLLASSQVLRFPGLSFLTHGPLQ